MINKYSTNTEEKISKFLKDYKTKDEQIAQWKHEYEVLDACCELAQGKIAELKAENDKLKEEVRTEKIYSSQVEELEESLNHLKQENDTLKDKLLDAEAVMLTYKADKDKYYQQTLDDEIQINELLQTLQEIKTIVKNICDGCTSECDCDEDCNYFLITEALTKAEEE